MIVSVPDRCLSFYFGFNPAPVTYLSDDLRPSIGHISLVYQAFMLNCILLKTFTKFCASVKET